MLLRPIEKWSQFGRNMGLKRYKIRPFRSPIEHPSTFCILTIISTQSIPKTAPKHTPFTTSKQSPITTQKGDDSKESSPLRAIDN